jgi:gluconolactonase
MKRQTQCVAVLFVALFAGASGHALADHTAAPTGQPPSAVIDLTTREGVVLTAANWRYSDVVLVPAEHRAPDDAGQPTGPVVATWDFSPHAGLRDYDDSGWSVLAPGTLAARRGNGKVSFNWYRINVTVPARVGDFDTRGARIEFETSVDDYAEVWVDGELPRATGQNGGTVIAGWNATNRVTIGRNVQPGQRIQLAIFGINGPLSDPPANFIWLRLARLAFYPGAPGDDGPLAVEPQEVNVRVARLQPGIDRIIPANPKIFKLAEGFQFTEGPVWLRDQGELLFSDPNANRIYVYDPAAPRLSVFREQSGYAGSDIGKYKQPGSNGLTRDAAGRLTINEHGNRRVIRLEADGRTTTLADRYQGRRLNSPNDLVYRSDGAVYFTDPPFGLPKAYTDPRKELDFSGVYRAKDGVVTLLTRELGGPNGLAFSPDEQFLYVDNWDPARKVVLRFPVRANGELGKSEIFADMTTELPGDEALDGLKVDTQGNVYVAAPDGVRIYSAAGAHLGTITAPRPVHNFAWGGADGRTLYLCARDRLYRIDLMVEGIRP